MNKISTIKEINNKAWYRLLKIVYITTFVLFFIFIYYLIIGYNNGFTQINQAKTKITCLVGNEKTFTAEELDLYLTTSDFKNGFNYKYFFTQRPEFDIQNIMAVCSPDKHAKVYDIYFVQRIIEIKLDKTIPQDQKDLIMKEEGEKISGTLSTSDKIKFLNFDTEIFNITPEYNYKIVPFQLILATLIIISLFELIRRLFYYVVLGKLKPNKE